MSSDNFVYQMGVTTFNVGTSLNFHFKPPTNCNGLILKATASVAIVNGLSAAEGDGIVPTSDIKINGPAQFYLASAGDEDVEVIVFKSANDSIYG